MDILHDEAVIDYLVDRIFDLQGEENPRLPRLRLQLEDVENRIKNIITAIEQGIIFDSTKDRLAALEKEKSQLDLTIVQEQIKKPFLTKEQIRFGIEKFKKLDISTKEGKQRLIDGFINAIYLYDDKITFTFNYKDGTKTVFLSELNCTPSGSDLKCLGALGGYKSFKTFKNGEKPDVFKYVLWMFISFIITATVIYSLEYAYARTDIFGMEIEVGSEMSGGSKAGLIIGAIFLFVVYAMQKAKEGKSLLSVKTLYKLGFIALALVFAAVTLSCIGKCVIKESMEEVDSGMTIYQEMNYSAAAYLSYLISLELGMSVVDVGLEFATVMANLFAMAAIAVTFAKLFKAFMCDEEVDKVTFTAACASVVFSLINLIIACVLAGERGAGMAGIVTVSAGRTIVPFVFSLLTVGAIIAHGFFNSNREKPVVNESGNQEERAVIEETPSQMEEQTAE